MRLVVSHRTVTNMNFHRTLDLREKYIGASSERRRRRFAGRENTPFIVGHSGLVLAVPLRPDQSKRAIARDCDTRSAATLFLWSFFGCLLLRCLRRFFRLSPEGQLPTLCVFFRGANSKNRHGYPLCRANTRGRASWSAPGSLEAHRTLTAPTDTPFR